MADEFTKVALYGIKTFNKKVKEKIGMEKLIGLLNEFLKKEDKSIYTFYWNQVFNCIHRGNGERCDKEWICSKSFGFIKWLVENDKIGRNKNSDRSAMIDLMRAEVKEQTEVFEGTEKYEWYIMLLSIQESPIEFLISILKD